MRIEDLVTSMRTRSELARRLSAGITEPRAVAMLRTIADTLDAQAIRVRCGWEPANDR